MARKARNYKQTLSMTKSMGSAGAQRHIGKVNKLDPALASGYLNNVVVTGQINDLGPLVAGDPAPNTPGFTVYLSTANAGDWSDDAILTARAFGPMAGSVSLHAGRYIKTDDSDDLTSSTGPIHVWAEITDVTVVTDIEARFTLEFWGRFISCSLDESP